MYCVGVLNDGAEPYIMWMASDKSLTLGTI